MSELSPKKPFAALREYGEALLWALVFALIIRAFLVQAYTIPSGSMLQTVQIGDFVLVNKFVYGVKIPFTDSYAFRGADPERGDIIVFKYPKDTDTEYQACHRRARRRAGNEGQEALPQRPAR